MTRRKTVQNDSLMDTISVLMITKPKLSSLQTN